jgi:preprotein translocase subunit YajC
MENTETPKVETSYGPIIGIILIVLLLLIGAYYFLSQRISKLEEQKKTNALIELQNATTTIFSTTTIES